jgi:hypothetical protein
MLSQELCKKVSGLVKKYIKGFPDEFRAFKLQMSFSRNGLRTKWAELDGQGVVIREILQIPENLHNMLKAELTTFEFEEFQEEKYKIWFGNKFADFRSTEEKL